MTEPRITFEENVFYTRNTYRFYDDRIERDWDAIIRSGREIYPTANISEWIGEQTTFAYGLRRPLTILATCLLIGMVLHLAFEHPVLRFTGLVLYGFSGVVAIVALTKIKKDTWLYVNQTDGSTLFTVRAKGLNGISREEFTREIQRYANKA
ncbi:MAG TPA: hypothetical protein VLO11_01185 [Luteolibacter sp.]|nr:hypothetical protein [Luteolibacter sp.]